MIGTTALVMSGWALARPEVRHYHLTGGPSPLPARPCAGAALDELAHALQDWAEDHPGSDDADYACAVAEAYCGCRRSGGDSEIRADVFAHLQVGDRVAELLDGEVYEITPCADPSCLRFCPDPDCRTVERPDVGEAHPICGGCGTELVPEADFPWMN